MRCIVALLFGAAMLGAADPQFPAAAFYWDATHVAIVTGPASYEEMRNVTKMPDRQRWPPFGHIFAVPGINSSDDIKIGDTFDINLTGNFWVRARVNRFIYNKTVYVDWILAIATIDPGDRERYTAAIQAKLHVFLAERAQPKRVSDTGQIRNPVVKLDLPASERAALESHLNQMMTTQVRRARSKGQSAPENLLARLLSGKAELTVEVEEVDLGEAFGVRHHVLGTWSIGNEPVFSVQGWKRPNSDHIESLEAVDGIAEEKAEMMGALSDWAEESVDDFTIENVFAGGRLVRHSAGYESSNIYLERMTAKGREFARSLYGI